MFEKIDHINLTVRDLQESRAWYEKVFGFKQVESGIAMGGPYSIIASHDFAICMYEEPTRKTAEHMPEIHHQIYHFGIRVTDRDAWEEIVRKCELQLRYGGAISYPKSTSWYVRDPSGHDIEVTFTARGLWS